MKKIVLGVLGVIVLGIGVGTVYLYAAYPKIRPAPDISVEGTPQQIERGKYLAEHVAVCIDCHSTRDWSKFSGPIKPGTLGKGAIHLQKIWTFRETSMPEISLLTILKNRQTEKFTER